jgi:hypothetical protein
MVNFKFIFLKISELSKYSNCMSKFVLYLPVLLVLSLSLYYGVPFFKDNNETFQSFNQGWNLLFNQPINSSFLTDNTKFEQYIGDPIYIHNPNFPRYIHALLLLVQQDIVVHVALIGCVSFVLTAFFISRLFDQRIALTIITFTILDWIGFQYFTNTYRAWSFPLFWGCLYAMRRSWTAFFAFFILFQFEYGFAVFVAVTALIYHERWRERFWAIGGAMVSVALFGLQVISYVGLASLVDELILTANRRMAYGSYSWSSLYSLWILVLVAGTVLHDNKSKIGRLFLAMIVGGASVLIILNGYVREAFIVHGLPFITFYVVVSFSKWTLHQRWYALPLAVVLIYNSSLNLKSFPPIKKGWIEAVRMADGPVNSSGPLVGIAFAIRPQNGIPVYELCLDRPWFMISCGESYKISPIAN